MYNNAFIMEHNMRFSGGDEKYTYSTSLGYGDQNGVAENFQIHELAIHWQLMKRLNKQSIENWCKS